MREWTKLSGCVLMLLLTGCIRGGGSSGDAYTQDGTSDTMTDTVLVDLGELPDGAECHDGLTRCNPSSSGLQVCSGGTWTDGEACAVACEAGACTTTATEGTCTLPLPIGLDQTVSGNSGDAPAASEEWAQACTDSYRYSPTGSETVYALEITETTPVTIALDPGASTYYGLYVRSACGDTLTQLAGACDASPTAGDGAEISALLSPGTWYVFVDDFADPAGTGPYDLTVSRGTLAQCHGQMPTVLDLTSGATTVQGDTANGMNGTNWHEYACPVAFDTIGSELIYAFTIPEPSTVRVMASPTDPADSKLGLYMRSECENALGSGQIACSYSDGSGADATFTETLGAGTYFIFVDDLAGSQDGPQAFELTVELIE